MEFHGSLLQLKAAVEKLGVPCHWEHRHDFESAFFDDEVSNLKLNWWPSTGVIQMVGDPEVREDMWNRLLLALDLWSTPLFAGSLAPSPPHRGVWSVHPQDETRMQLESCSFWGKRGYHLLGCHQWFIQRLERAVVVDGPLIPFDLNRLSKLRDSWHASHVTEQMIVPSPTPLQFSSYRPWIVWFLGWRTDHSSRFWGYTVASGGLRRIWMLNSKRRAFKRSDWELTHLFLRFLSILSVHYQISLGKDSLKCGNYKQSLVYQQWKAGCKILKSIGLWDFIVTRTYVMTMLAFWLIMDERCLLDNLLCCCHADIWGTRTLSVSGNIWYEVAGRKQMLFGEAC